MRKRPTTRAARRGAAVYDLGHDRRPEHSGEGFERELRARGGVRADRAYP
jgi:hypothetical protein